MPEGKIGKNVHRLVRKRVTRVSGDDKKQARAAPPPCSWACPLVAVRADTDDEPEPLRVPLPRQQKRVGWIGLIAGLAALAWGTVGWLLPGRRRGTILKALAVAAVALPAGLFLEYTTGITAPVMAYIDGLIQDVREWFTPTTQTALAAGSLLVIVGLWLVVQILRTAPREAPSHNSCIPREMYERHA